ncbi:MAG: phage baseplate assembly protein V [Cyanobacteria bacterium J06638_6]
MTTLTLYETIQRIVQEELSRQQTAELAVVQENHPHADAGDTDNYACTVVLRNTGLVLRQVPVATPRVGQVSIPSVGDLVLVQFVGGNLNAPIITGSLYSDAARPPANQPQQAIWHLPADAAEDDALRVAFTGSDPKEITVSLGTALTVTLLDDDPVVSINVDGGKAAIAIDRDGAITITSQGDIAMEGNNISVKAQANLTLEAQGETVIKGATVNIN